MPQIKKIATRQSYGEVLAELGEENKNIVVLDADLSGSTKTSIFAKKFPDRFINCGIAEGNMAAVAAGLAAAGKIPFMSSFAMFAVGRAFEQIRNSICLPGLNVKICASHAGVSVGADGGSHQCLEDIALMRMMPNMVVMSPSDDVEARAAVRKAAEINGPVYIRLGRLAVPVINDYPEYKFEFGKGQLLRNGSDVTIITGLCDHNDYLIDYTTPFEVQIGRFTLFHSGDCCSHTKLHVLRRPDLWVFHPYCGMDPVAGCREAINPKLAVIAHLQELGHAKNRYRWTYRDGLDEKAKLEEVGFSARMPLWGERLV